MPLNFDKNGDFVVLQLDVTFQRKTNGTLNKIY